MTDTRTLYRSDSRPVFEPFTVQPPPVKGFQYEGDLAYELRSRSIDGAAAVDLLDDMLAIRELEEMIVRLRSGGYEPLSGYAYRGPTHVSIGQEGTAVGASSVLGLTDRITSSHRGHGDAIAKGFSAIRQMDEEQLKERVPWSKASDRTMACWQTRSRNTSTAPSPSSSARTRATAPGAVAACTSATSRPVTSAPMPSSAAVCPSPPAPPWHSATWAPVTSSSASPVTVPTPTASCSSHSTGPRNTSGRTSSPATRPMACPSSMSSRTTTTG